MSVDVKQVSMEGVQIGFRNFSGVEGQYNKAGDRNFVVFLDKETADKMSADGWNVKYPKDRDDIDPEEDERNPYLPVSVGFGAYPPKIVLINGGKATKLDEESVDMLDWAEIKDVDLIVRPYNWTVNGQSGVKAYLKAIYVTINEDEFAEKYGI